MVSLLRIVYILNLRAIHECLSDVSFRFTVFCVGPRESLSTELRPSITDDGRTRSSPGSDLPILPCLGGCMYEQKRPDTGFLGRVLPVAGYWSVDTKMKRLAIFACSFQPSLD